MNQLRLFTLKNYHTDCPYEKVVLNHLIMKLNGTGKKQPVSKWELRKINRNLPAALRRLVPQKEESATERACKPLRRDFYYAKDLRWSHHPEGNRKMNGQPRKNRPYHYWISDHYSEIDMEVITREDMPASTPQARGKSFNCLCDNLLRDVEVTHPNISDYINNADIPYCTGMEPDYLTFRLMNGQPKVSNNNKVNKIYSDFAEQPKAVRDQATLDGIPLVSVDIEASHPTFLAAELLKAFERNSVPSPLPAFPIKKGHGLSEVSKKVDTGFKAFKPVDTAKEFVRTVASRDIYQELADDLDTTRGRVKDAFHKFLNTDIEEYFEYTDNYATKRVNDSRIKLYEALVKRWVWLPGINEELDELGVYLQKKEAEFMDKALDTLDSVGIEAIPVYDAVYVKTNKAEAAKQLIQNLFNEDTGMPLTVRIEHTDHSQNWLHSN